METCFFILTPPFCIVLTARNRREVAAEKAAAEKAAAEKVDTNIWELSDREREIVKSLGK